MSETTIKFLLDDFKLINNPGSIDVLQLDLFEPQELEENMISYFIFVGPTLELNKIFHHRNISEKHALLGKKISFKLKEGRSSDQFYNYENSATSKSNLKSSHEGGTKIEKDCLLLSVFDSKEEKNDISSFEISNENSALTIEKDYLIDILKINPASEEKIAELDAEIKKFEEKAGNDENKKWA
ncbi:10365_t:CDS:2 [Gigaspora margarita]|uniref:10365_t:CDS:1 n=1 Tax=Gigaspora margarita TaxID=4874 RepID=A0ABN7VQK4_GIGMA|nr:10365_t:CDS:2 [Gigaspora margarita]